METKFQTSFIPKKPTSSTIGSISTGPQRPRHFNSVFMTIATLFFIVSLAGVGGVYGYKLYLMKEQVALKTELATREQQFDPALIATLKTEDTTLVLARKVLNEHIALSQVFDLIGRLTIENVRFLSLDVIVPPAGSNDTNVKISLQGYGTSLAAVAFQSDVLGQLDQVGLRQIVKNPILSNPSIGAVNQVSFGLTATLDSKNLSYEHLVSPKSASSTSTN